MKAPAGEAGASGGRETQKNIAPILYHRSLSRSNPAFEA